MRTTSSSLRTVVAGLLSAAGLSQMVSVGGAHAKANTGKVINGHKTQFDIDRLDAAEIKRQRKMAKRAAQLHGTVQ